MRDCKTNNLYKNKCDMSDCNNYRGISIGTFDLERSWFYVNSNRVNT